MESVLEENSMLSPFPGMDPYLEAPRFWPGFHNILITDIVGVLNAGLPSNFAANAEERVYILPPRHAIIPDVAVSRIVGLPAPLASGRTATLEPDTTHGVLVARPERESEMFVEIRSVKDWNEIVTIIEVLSPTNKTANSEGMDAYLDKQADVLESKTNLLEIDLLRGGTYSAAAPYEFLRARGSWDHLVCLHRSAQRYHYEYWFNRLRDALPTVMVPLTPDYPDFELDLQAVFTQAYDTGPYKRLVDYHENPLIPLDDETAIWADALLQERGLR
jgi:hypothetical protein